MNIYIKIFLQKAHRLILAMSSPVFERMLFGPLAEGEELKLPEDPPEAFKWLMKYIYHGTKELADVKLTVQVYHLASKYQMDALGSLCSKVCGDISEKVFYYDIKKLAAIFFTIFWMNEMQYIQCGKSRLKYDSFKEHISKLRYITKKRDQNFTP